MNYQEAIKKIDRVLCKHFSVTCPSHGEAAATDILSLFVPNLPPHPWADDKEKIMKFLEELHRIHWNRVNYYPSTKMDFDKLAMVVIDEMHTINGLKRANNQLLDESYSARTELESMKTFMKMATLPEEVMKLQEELIKAKQTIEYQQYDLANLQKANDLFQLTLAKNQRTPGDTVKVVCHKCQNRAVPSPDCDACNGEGCFYAKIAKKENQ